MQASIPADSLASRFPENFYRFPGIPQTLVSPLEQHRRSYAVSGGAWILWLDQDWAISAGLPSLCRTYSTGLPYFRFFSKAYSCESGSKLRNLWISAVLFPPSFRPFAILSEDSGSSENLLQGGKLGDAAVLP